jgi:membrane-bound metal-dependent hydrolase YbcI (DUF457 family)
MPGYKAHFSVAAASGAGIMSGLYWFGYFKPEPMLMAGLLAVVIMASLFPDVDTHSKGRKLYYAIMACVDIVLLINKEYQWAAALGFAAMLPAVGDHRGWTHTWWAMLSVPLLLLSIPMAFFHYPWRPLLPFYCAAVFGYFTHLALDKKFR